jgi:hypothetical protein
MRNVARELLQATLGLQDLLFERTQPAIVAIIARQIFVRAVDERNQCARRQFFQSSNEAGLFGLGCMQRPLDRSRNELDARVLASGIPTDRWRKPMSSRSRKNLKHGQAPITG